MQLATHSAMELFQGEAFMTLIGEQNSGDDKSDRKHKTARQRIEAILPS